MLAVRGRVTCSANPCCAKPCLLVDMLFSPSRPKSISSFLQCLAHSPTDAPSSLCDRVTSVCQAPSPRRPWTTTAFRYRVTARRIATSIRSRFHSGSVVWIRLSTRRCSRPRWGASQKCVFQIEWKEEERCHFSMLIWQRVRRAPLCCARCGECQFLFVDSNDSLPLFSSKLTTQGRRRAACCGPGYRHRRVRHQHGGLRESQRRGHPWGRYARYYC